MSPQSKRVKSMENEQDETDETTIVKKNFSSLPPQLRELILLKTDTYARLKLFQINNELRGWVLKKEFFGEDLEKVSIYGSYKAGITARDSGFYLKVYGYEYIFKAVRRCKKLFLPDCHYPLTRVFPRLQSINIFDFGGSDFTRLSQNINAIQLTGFCRFYSQDHEEGGDIIDENFFRFIENHLKLCKTVNFERFRLDKLFVFLRTQHFPKTIFEYRDSLRDRGFDFERDLKMIMKNGIPSLNPDSVIWLIIHSLKVDELMIRLFDIISEGTDVVRENEAIRKKFLVSYEKVAGSLTSDPCAESDRGQFCDRSDRDFSGLKRKFDEERDLIFLVCPIVDVFPNKVNIHIKFDPIEE